MRLNCGPMALAYAALILAASLPVAAADQDQAMTYFKAGKFLEAAGEFQALIDEHPDYSFAYFMLGNCFLKTDKVADAEKNLVKAVELNGDKFEYHYQLANAYARMDKPAKVIGTLNNAEALAANDQYKQALHKLRGLAHYTEKNWEQAVSDLSHAGSDPDVVERLAKAYFKLGDNEKAAKAFANAVKASPDDAELHQLYAENLLTLALKSGSDSQKQKYYSEALAQAEAFRKLEPDSFDAHNLLGRAALGAQQFDRAVSSFTTALQKDPDQCNAMINLGKALMSKEDWVNSYRSFDNATQCDPKMAMAWENKAYTLQKQDKLEEAIQVYQKALTLDPGSSFAKNNIEVCRQNILIRDENMAIAQKEAEQREAAEQAQREYEEAMARQKEWEKKQEEDD